MDNYTVVVEQQMHYTHLIQIIPQHHVLQQFQENTVMLIIHGKLQSQMVVLVAVAVLSVLVCIVLLELVEHHVQDILDLKIYVHTIVQQHTQHSEYALQQQVEQTHATQA
jgi:hypothetical protein